MTTTASGDRDRIRALNDHLRKECLGGAIVCTSGLAALPEDTRREIMAAVKSFDAFGGTTTPMKSTTLL